MSEKMKKLEEIIKETSKVFKELEEEMLKKGKEVWEQLEYDDRLALMCYISKVLHEHAIEGGTYRYLIYERLGFDLDAYAPLQLCGLLSIHNLISGELKIDFGGENECSDVYSKE